MAARISKKTSRGFSLVELMVGMLIALISTLAILQVFTFFEGQKRTTTSGSDALQSGAIALYQIERDIRQAGYGFNSLTLMGCTIKAYDEGAGTPYEFDFKLIPVQIVQGVGTNPDTITISYGNSPLQTAPALITADYNGSAANFKVNNRFGFKEGDLVVIAEPGKDCTLAQVTGLPAAVDACGGGGSAAQTDNIIHNSGNYKDPNQGCQQVAARYNKPSGLGIAYNVNSPVFNLGGMPTINEYSIQNNQLMVRNVLTPDPAVAIMDGVVSMHAQYGFDTRAGIISDLRVDPNTGYSDTMVDADGNGVIGDSGDFSRIGSVRLVVVARSGLREKPDPATGLCNVTSAASFSLNWAAGAISLPDDADGTSWKCYRYKTFETTVPVRNMIWRPA